jgi:hypothetical protein
MNLNRLLNTEMGRVFISMLLGIGLASLFRRACTDKNCIVFNGPIYTDFEGKIYKYGEKCYKYSVSPTKCDKMKRVIDIEDQVYNLDGTQKTITPAPTTSIFSGSNHSSNSGGLFGFLGKQ